MKLSEKSLPVRYLRRLVTFILVTFAWLIFRANSISDLGVLLSRLFEAGAPISETFSLLGLDLTTSLLIIVSVLTLFFMDNLITYEETGDGSDAVIKNGAFVYAVWTVLIVWILLFSNDMISTFIYFAF